MEAHPLPSAYAKYTVSKRFQTPMAEILHEVQLHHVFPDSKEFVDMPMRKDPQEICDSWRELLSQEDSLILNKEVLLKFVEEHFAPPGSDMVWNSKQLSWPHTTNPNRNPAVPSQTTQRRPNFYRKLLIPHFELGHKHWMICGQSSDEKRLPQWQSIQRGYSAQLNLNTFWQCII